MKRREALGTMALAVGAGMAPRVLRGAPAAAAVSGRLKQSVSYWPYSKIPLPEFAAKCKAMGLAAVDLLYQPQWQIVKDAGLTCSMAYASNRQGFLQNGFGELKNHDMLVAELEQALPLAAAAGIPNLIAMFGNRRGMSDDEGISNCVTGLRRIAPSAERHGVTICVELLNSKVDHKDYMGDHTGFGVKVMEGVGSPRVKLLYDIYHMQIMEGDIIRTIRNNIAQIGHFHTGGVPGRHELDDTQELNWRTVCTAIVEARWGANKDQQFTGYLAHEFVPTRDPLTSLAEAVKLCDV